MLDHLLGRIRGSELGIRFRHGTTSGFDCRGGTLNRQNRKFSVCRALGKRLGSRFYQESARAKNKNGNSFTTSLRMVTLELRYQLDQANWVSNGRICLKFTFLQ